MDFILTLLICQDYFYLRFFLIAVPTSHDYLKCHFLREASFTTLEEISLHSVILFYYVPNMTL